MAKQKIVFILPNLMNGGAERVASNWIMNFSDELFEKHIILFDSGNIAFPYSGKLINLNTPSSNNVFIKILYFFIRFFKIRKSKKINRYDFSISLINSANLLNILTQQSDKTIITIHSFKSKRTNSLYGRFFKYIIKYFFNRSNSIVSVSNEIKNDLISNFNISKEKLTVIHNFIDIDNINKQKILPVDDKKLENIFKNKVIINVGRPSYEKGQWHLIRSFSYVKKYVNDIKLVIIGEGNLSHYLQRLISEMDLDDDVFLIGYQQNPFKFMYRSEIFAFSSLVEGFPLVPLEAMCCELPIISTNCKSGPKEILSPEQDFDENQPFHAKYGILTPVCDGKLKYNNEPLTSEEILLSKKIIELLGNSKEQEKYKQQIKKRIEDFSPNNILEEWYTLIKTLTDNK